MLFEIQSDQIGCIGACGLTGRAGKSTNACPPAETCILPEEITMNTTFVDDLGADSLDVFQIIMGIEEEFDIEIPTEEAEKIASVGDAVEAIKNALN